MKIFYDNHFFYSYICFSKYDEQEIQLFIDLLKSRGIEVLRIYNPPRYPASDGEMYAFLLQISYKDPSKKEKYSTEEINTIIKDFYSRRSAPMERTQDRKDENEFLTVLKNEFNYINTLKVFLESERKILIADRKIIENDKKLAKTQLKELTGLTANLQKETAKIQEIIVKNSEKLSKDIASVLDKKDVSYKELLALNEQLIEKEKTLKETEKTIRSQEREFNAILQEKYEYFESLEDDFALRQLALKEKEDQLELQHQERYNELRATFVDAYTPSVSDPAQDLRVLIIGSSSLDSRQIYQVFNSHYREAFNFPLENHVIDSQYLDYDEVKGVDIAQKLKSNKYDYVIIGPMPHSIKGKEESKNWKTFFRDNNLKGIPFTSMAKTLSKSEFDHLAKTIVADWQSKVVSLS